MYKNSNLSLLAPAANTLKIFQFANNNNNCIVNIHLNLPNHDGDGATKKRDNKKHLVSSGIFPTMELTTPRDVEVEAEVEVEEVASILEVEAEVEVEEEVVTILGR